MRVASLCCGYFALTELAPDSVDSFPKGDTMSDVSPENDGSSELE